MEIQIQAAPKNRIAMDNPIKYGSLIFCMLVLPGSTAIKK
jgi:hypothetical protein